MFKQCCIGEFPAKHERLLWAKINACNLLPYMSHHQPTLTHDRAQLTIIYYQPNLCSKTKACLDPAVTPPAWLQKQRLKPEFSKRWGNMHRSHLGFKTVVLFIAVERITSNLVEVISVPLVPKSWDTCRWVLALRFTFKQPDSIHRLSCELRSSNITLFLSTWDITNARAILNNYKYLRVHTRSHLWKSTTTTSSLTPWLSHKSIDILTWQCGYHSWYTDHRESQTLPFSNNITCTDTVTCIAALNAAVQ